MINVDKDEARMEGSLPAILSEMGIALSALKRGMVQEKGMPEEIFDMLAMSAVAKALAKDLDDEDDVFLMRSVVPDRTRH